MRTLCVTLGDPCGLGPELVVRHFSKAGHADNEQVLIIGPELSVTREMERYCLNFDYTVVTDMVVVTEMGPGIYLYEPKELSRLGFPPGKPVVEGGLAAGASLDAAITALKSGVADGLLTCPLNKAMLHKAGFQFPGHTEFLAEKLGVGVENVCMHLCGHDPVDPVSPKLRVSLVTTHPALRDVPRLVTAKRIGQCLELTANFVKIMGFLGPVAVCGLNPHAGESGQIGDEEDKVIIPAIAAAKSEGMDVAGPFPADTVFHFAAKGDYSAVLAMYHDQGLGPLKLMHFSEAVNVTLGLPYPRTSPDHGTGYDLVGTGRASTKSFVAALDMLRRLLGGKG